MAIQEVGPLTNKETWAPLKVVNCFSATIDSRLYYLWH